MVRRLRLHACAAGAVAVALVLSAAGCSSLVGPDAVADAPHWSVVGYAEAGSTPDRRVRASAAAVTTMGIDGVNISSGGSSVTSPSPDALRLLRRAHERKQSGELLVGDFDSRSGDFSPSIGDALLGSRAHIDAVTRSLAHEVRQHRWDGVTIDLESLTDNHPGGLVDFTRLLKQRIGVGRSVSICLMATTGDYSDLGYDLEALGVAADHVVLMAYDQHGPTWTKAGPVGGTPWVGKALAPLLATVPRSKIELGVAGYGYTWPRSTTGRQLSDAAARREATRNAEHIAWDPRQQEWHAVNRDGTAIWWSDARTFRARASFARSLGLGGVAVWSLGLSDPITAVRTPRASSR